MYTLGLIGNKLGHSWSQQWFEAMFRREGICGASYSLFELPNLNDIRSWAAEKKLDGFNVTIPYKQDILPFLDELDPTVSAIGAANCIEIRQERLIGHNTDAPAFLQTLQPILRPCHSQALVLGSGGASKAVSFALHKLGISHIVVSRHPENGNNTIGYDQAANLANSHLLIINTTPGRHVAQHRSNALASSSFAHSATLMLRLDIQPQRDTISYRSSSTRGRYSKRACHAASPSRAELGALEVAVFTMLSPTAKFT